MLKNSIFDYVGKERVVHCSVQTSSSRGEILRDDLGHDKEQPSGQDTFYIAFTRTVLFFRTLTLYQTGAEMSTKRKLITSRCLKATLLPSLPRRIGLSHEFRDARGMCIVNCGFTHDSSHPDLSYPLRVRLHIERHVPL